MKNINRLLDSSQVIKSHRMSELDYILKNSNPSDYILFSAESQKILDDFAEKIFSMNAFNNPAYANAIPKQTYANVIPSDLFVADSIPLPDVVFVIDTYNDDEKYTKRSEKVYLRFVYFNNEMIVVVNNLDGSTASFKIFNNDLGACINPDYIYVPDAKYPFLKGDFTAMEYKFLSLNIANNILTRWYALQIMLLNPAIKERVFTETQKKKLRCKNEDIVGSNVKSRKRKAMYVRYKEISNTILESGTSRKRHTMCWYVIGHYRHYKTGKTVFIKGYWKGPMRQLQKNLDEGRERLIAR